MRTGRALTIAAIIGTVLLIPVIAILGLGLYGSSITGDFPLSEPSGPRLEIDPSRGPPGAAIEVRGQRWEARTLIQLEMVVQSSRPEIGPAGEVRSLSSALPAVFVAEVIASRAGTFSAQAQLPTTIPLTRETDVEFVATATYRGGEPAGEARTTFQIDPGPGRIDIVVQAESDSLPVADALVELRTAENELVVARRTDAQGHVSLDGLSLGLDYQVLARAPGFAPLTSVTTRATESDPSVVTFVLPHAAAGRAFVGGVPIRGTQPDVSLAMLDLPSLTPLQAPAAAGAAWAMAADAQRGHLFLADEIATEVRVLDAVGGRSLPPIPLAFSVQVEVVTEAGEPIPGAFVRLFWDVRGQLVLARTARADDGGMAQFDDLVSGSTYSVVVNAEGFAQERQPRPQVTVEPNAITAVRVPLRRAGVGAPPSAIVGGSPPLSDADRAPATALVISDLAVDPVSGLLYVTGSDLANGHLLVIDPDARRILHDWTVLAGVGDVAPDGDGRHVYLANRPFSSVTRVDATTGREVASTVVPSWPEAITVGADGDIFVASLREGRVTRLAGTSLEIEASRELEEGVNRISLALDDTTLLVSNIWTDTVTALDPDQLTVRFLLPVAKSPRAIAVDAVSGSLIVGSAERGTVAFYSTEDFTLLQRISLGIPINDIVTLPLAA